jgi:hypothetical protein
MRWGTTIVDHPESYPDDPPAVRADDIDQLQAAVHELEAVALHEQARHLAEMHATLAELYRRDGVQITDAELDAQADSLALLERGHRFLQDVATRLHPDGELLALARQVDDHGLGVWREAAGSLVDDCPPSLAHLRWRVEEEQRAELRSHAHLVRHEAQLGGLRRRLGLVGRLWRRRRAAELRDELADCRRRRERSARRLAQLDAKLQVIDKPSTPGPPGSRRPVRCWSVGWLPRRCWPNASSSAPVSKWSPDRRGRLPPRAACGWGRGRDRPHAPRAPLHLARLFAAGGGDGGV